MHTDSMRINMDRIVDASREGFEEGVAWYGEIHRRIADLESGRVQGIPLEETLASMRAILLVGEFAGG